MKLLPLAMTLVVSGCASAAAFTASQPVGQEVVPPFGYIGFCLRNPEDCQSQASSLKVAAFETKLEPPVHLTDDKWLQLNHVNDFVNRTVLPVDDLALHDRAEWWSYPTASGGDCEDFAMQKRKLLIARGWPANTLLLTVAKQWDGAGHAVLIAVTDRGEYVLDNQNWKVTLWHEAPYQWVKRQSRHHPYVWVNLDAGRQTQGSMTLSEPMPNAMDKRAFPKVINTEGQS